MKLTLTSMFALLSAMAASVVENSCDLWPSAHLVPMQACCVLPDYLEEKALSKCDYVCRAEKLENHSECYATCYVNETQIMKNGILDKALIKKIFNDTKEIDPYFDFNSTKRHKKLLSEAVDECEFKSTGKISNDLATFYDCVKNFTVKNCILHRNDLICDASIEFNEKCRKTPTKCDEFPQTRVWSFEHPKHCCNYPKIVTNDHYNKFMTACQKKEFFLYRRFECMYYETVKEAGMKNSEVFDFKVVKKMLIESSNKATNWESSIDKSLLTCKSEMKGRLRVEI